MPSLANQELWGPQFIVNEAGELLAQEERLLMTSVDLALEQIVEGVNAGGGMVVPAHVDRPAFSLLSNLGWIPEDLQVEALEVTSNFVPDRGYGRWPQLRSWNLIVGGDAHRLKEMQRRTLFMIEAPGLRKSISPYGGSGGVKW